MRIAVALILAMIATGCAPAPPAPYEIRQTANGDFRINADDTQAIVTTTYAYWAAVDAGRWAEAWEYHAGDFREILPYNQWLETVEGMPPEVRRPAQISWLKNAQRVHGPELYAVVTWVSQTSRGGRITWRQRDDGVWEIENLDRY